MIRRNPISNASARPRRTALKEGHRLLGSRPPVLSAAGLFVVGIGVAAIGLAGAAIAAAMVPRLIGASGGDMPAWGGLSIGLTLMVLAGGAITILARSAVTLELHLIDGPDGSLVVRRHPFRDRVIPRERIRCVRVRGRLDRRGRPQAVAEIDAGGPPVQFLVDVDRDVDRLLDRIREPIDRVAGALNVPVERSGWTLDPGVRPSVDRSSSSVAGWD